MEEIDYAREAPTPLEKQRSADSAREAKKHRLRSRSMEEIDYAREATISLEKHYYVSRAKSTLNIKRSREL